MMDTLLNTTVHFPDTDVHCKDIAARRRQARASEDINGIDFVEVDEIKKKKIVVLHLLKPCVFQLKNVEIDGLEFKFYAPLLTEDRKQRGKKKTNETEKAESFFPFARHQYKFEVLEDNKAVDINKTYKFKLHAIDKPESPIPGFDPLLSEAEFSFDVNTKTDQDIPTKPACPPTMLERPDINYLAKDYASFRQLAYDRLSLIMPEWKERHVPDLGVTLVELLAYVGDYLSYYQDAVATEAYLNTARQRISVRRHARLVDYRMHEGCNARTLLCLTIDPNVLTINLDDVYFITDHDLAFPLKRIVSRESDLIEANINREQYEIFEPVEKENKDFYHVHNLINFYTWGKRECCLPMGATRAALRDGSGLPTPPEPKPETTQDMLKDEKVGTEQKSIKPDEMVEVLNDQEISLLEELDQTRILKLEKGDVLIFEEVRDPRTGLEEDADPSHRHAVRLTNVKQAYDLPNHQAVLEIEWDQADALPFPLCLSATSDDCIYYDDISIAHGNVILVDHGEMVEDELDPVGSSEPQKTCDECGEVFYPNPRHYNPHLKRYPLIFRETPSLLGPISSLLNQRDPRAALPVVMLHEMESNKEWLPRYDLLSSGGDDRDFVVEVDDERIAHLRFGDDELGEQPTPGTQFTAYYRIGEPLAGNVGADAITRVIFRNGYTDGVTGVRNPMAAIGGITPEKVEDVKLHAPYAFRQRMLRAITADDYARLVEQGFPEVQKAYASLGESEDQTNRFTVNIWYDLFSGMEVTKDQIEAYLSPFRRIGHDLKVNEVKFILVNLSVTRKKSQNTELEGNEIKPVDATSRQKRRDIVKEASEKSVNIDITIMIKEHAIWELVMDALRLVLGSMGFFHPDRLTFGKGISLSQIVTAIQNITGVEYVHEIKVDDKTRWPSSIESDLIEFDQKNGEIPTFGTLNFEEA